MPAKKFFPTTFLLAALFALTLLLAGKSTPASGANQASSPAAGTYPPRLSLNQPGVIAFLTAPTSSAPEALVRDQIAANRGQLGLSETDVADLVVTDQYVSTHNGVTHFYLRQRYQGIEVNYGDVSAHVTADGQLIALHSTFVPDLAGRIAAVPAALTAADAAQAAADHFGLEVSQPLTALSELGGADQATVLSDGGISAAPIPARLMYQYTEAGIVRLVWNVIIDDQAGNHWWDAYVDAADGAVLWQNDWVIADDWSGPAGATAASFTRNADAAPQGGGSDTYFVIPIPYESPNHLDGNNGLTTPGVLVADPADSVASPHGWHSDDGVAGADYTITRGNNVHAYRDALNTNTPDPGSEPDGGAGLDFNEPADFNEDPNAYYHAAIINLFYMINIMHDVSYQYGFDEAAGNFQETNHITALGLGSDYIYGEAQDGAGLNNANFSGGPDGSNARIQMFIFNITNPRRDGDLDNGIIAHEYGHGISGRLTGGPATMGCLSNLEQMGEGWSDYQSLYLGDDGVTTHRGMGTYVLGQPTDGPGVRPAPYDPNFAQNSYTYANRTGVSIPHGVGFIWATMLWDMHVALINTYGYDSDFYNGTGGNNIAYQLVMDGLKLQPCSPGFVDGRDAILQADMINNGGANQCLIWQAFADRGLGFSASQGSSNSLSDGSAAFDIPIECTFTEFNYLPIITKD